MIKISKCISCNSELSNAYSRMYLKGYKLSLYKIITCNMCKLSFVEKFPNEDTLNNFYSNMKSNYLFSDLKSSDYINLKFDKFGTCLTILNYFDNLKKIKNSKLLDVGPGNGTTLKH